MSTLNFHLTLLFLGLCLGCSRTPPTPTPPKSNAIRSATIDPQANAESPDPSNQTLPPAVYQDSDGSVRLSPLTAKLHGDGLDLDEWDRIAGFKNRDQRALWQIHLSAPGTYQVEVDAICTGPTQEARMRVYVGENRFVEDSIQLSENDQTLMTTSLGELTLDAPETYRVEVEMVGLPLIGKFAVSEIRLVSPGETPSTLPRFKTDDGLTEGNQLIRRDPLFLLTLLLQNGNDEKHNSPLAKSSVPTFIVGRTHPRSLWFAEYRRKRVSTEFIDRFRCG